MKKINLGESQRKFAEMIWDNEPVSSGTLVKMASEQFGWKSTTTYTVLKNLINKGLFKNENGTVSSVLTKEQYDSLKTEAFLRSEFKGSATDLLLAFTETNKLSNADILSLEKLIQQKKEELQ
ncbi:MAG: BlaI/MecI/CopY family transcriptional regulator [Lachnospiraceae bacterium]|nr:BlaI/MecI/CopY family transcriptional regulator [Lachnospiraceae bacterium]